MIKQFFSVAKYTVLENFRARMLGVIAIIFFVFYSFFNSCCCSNARMSLQGLELTSTDQAILSLKAGYWLIFIIGVLSTVLFSMTALKAEFDTDRIYLIFARPISRSTWLFGKIFGTWLSVLIDVTIIMAIVYGAVVIKHPELIWQPILPFLIVYFNLLVFTIIIMVMSLVLPSVLAGFIGIIIIALSMFLCLDLLQAYFFDLKTFFSQENQALYAFLTQIFSENPSPVMKTLYGIAYFLVPQFGNLHDIAKSFIEGKSVQLSLDWWSFLQVAIIGSVMLWAGHYLIRKKSF